MKFTTVAFFLATLSATLALPQGSPAELESAIPQPDVIPDSGSEAAAIESSSQLAARTQIVLARTCNGDNFTGHCVNWVSNSPTTGCTNTGVAGQQNTISSMRVYGSRCTFWTNFNCNGGSTITLLPGTSLTRNGLYGNVISSFACRG